jgi:hypothetical protein
MSQHPIVEPQRSQRSVAHWVTLARSIIALIAITAVVGTAINILASSA